MLQEQIMDELCPSHYETQFRPDHIEHLADYLRHYPQEIVDSKRLLRAFRVSASEFYQALLLIDRQPLPQSCESHAKTGV